MAEVTDEQVRKAVEEEAEEDPEFLASLTEGLSSQRDVRERAARRLDVDEALLKPFKKTIKAVMTDLWTAPDAEPEALEKVVKKPAKKRSPRPKKDKPQPKKDKPAKAEDAPESLLRGKLTIDKTGRLVWSGAWAFGADAWKRGERSKFRLASKKPLVVKDIAEAKVSGVIESGRWLACRGWFCLKTSAGPQAKEKEFQARLRFVNESGWRVEGRGANRFGRWVLTSKLCDLANGTCAAARSYATELSTSILASDQLLEDDDDDEDFDGGDSDDDGKVDPAKPKRAPPIQLRGRISGEGGVYTWSGRWTESKRSDEGGAFELKGGATRRNTTEDGVVPAHLDLSGGFEIGEGETKRTIREPVVSLHLEPPDASGARSASGRGQNEFGDFRLRGTLTDGELRCTKRYSKPRPISSDEDESDDEVDKDPEELNQLITEAADFTAQSAPRSKRQAASHAERAISQQNLRAERGSLIAWDQASLQAEVDALKSTIAAGAAEQPLIIHLRALHAKSLTVDLLSATGVGKVVAQLRKHESTKVSAMAAALVKGWKALVTAQK